MRKIDLPEFVQICYAAAGGLVDPEEFGHILCDMVDAENAAIQTRTHADGIVRLRFNRGISARGMSDYEAYYGRLDPWWSKVFSLENSISNKDDVRVYLSQDLISDRELTNTEFYHDYAASHGPFHLIGSILPAGPIGDIGIAMFRDRNASRFGAKERTTLQELLPHFGHAVRLQHRLGERYLLDIAAALNALVVGAAIIDKDLRVVAGNISWEKMLKEGLLRAKFDGVGIRVGMHIPRDQATFEMLVYAATATPGRSGSIALRQETGRINILITVVPFPVSYGSSALFSLASKGPRALVVARNLTQSSGPPPDQLIELLGLTHSEVEIAIAVASGSTAGQVARSRGVSEATVRTQIRSCLEKTGSSSLRSLVQLLTRIGG